MPSELNATDSIKIFISYSHEDEKLKQRLLTHLSPLMRKRKDLIRTWDDQQIKAGDEHNEELMKNFDEFNIILCLISPDFINTDYCYLLQAQPALDRQKAGKVKVVPILLKPTDWKNTIFSIFEIIPRDRKAITLQRSREEAFTKIAKEIDIIIEDFHHKTS